MVCLTPGVTGDSPINDTLQAGWESLPALGNKHIEPNVRNIRVSQEDVLSQIYTRGAWNPAPQHNIILTCPGGPRRLRRHSQAYALLERQHAYGGYLIQ